jgi:NAD-dependent SIR2 family protein deacetylase
MPKVQEQGNSIPSSLHYALTDSQCNKCGAQLEWNAEFNDINSPKYTSQHCGQDYLITIDSVKVELVKHSITEQGTKERTGRLR